MSVDPTNIWTSGKFRFLIDLAHPRVSVAQWWSIGARNPIPHGDSEFFSFSHARDKTKNIFLYFFTELDTYHLSYCIYKHD